MTPLTDRQREVYRCILECFAVTGTAPTIRDLCIDLDISSPNGVVCHLEALAAKGWIAWNRDGRSRGIEVPAIAHEVRARAGLMLAEVKG